MKRKSKKKTVFSKVNSGKIMVIIGSAQKMVAGINLQQRLKILHHLDYPWHPEALEQREDRIVR